MESNRKAASAIWIMYCQKRGMNPDAQININGYDKVNRVKVDECLYDNRIKDIDPLIGE